MGRGAVVSCGDGVDGADDVEQAQTITMANWRKTRTRPCTMWSYVLEVAREPMILLGGGAELKAYASAGQAALLLIVVPAFGWLASRTSRIQLLTGVQMFFVGCLLAFYALAQAAAPIGLALYLWLGIFNVLVISNFWSFANDVYTPEQGKRLFGVIGLGGSAGAILGALVPRALSQYIGPFELMLVAAAGLVVSVVLYRIVDHRRSAAEPRARVEEPMGHSGGFELVLRDPYLRLIAIMVVIATTVNTSGEYVVSKLVTEASGPSPDPRGYISSFYSSYYAGVNIVSALIQGLLVSRVIEKIGVRRALFVMPLVTLGGWVAFLVSSTIGMIRISKSAENSVDYSFHNTVRQALFLPTSREVKYKAKAAIDTFFFRTADVIAGLGIVFLLVEVLDVGVRGFAIVNVGLAIAWITLVAWTGKLHDARAHAAGEEVSRGAIEKVVR